MKLLKSYKLLIFFIFISFILPSVAYTGRAYRVVKLQDGDSFTATDGHIQFKVRMIGIDAPEHGQPYSQKAKEYLSQLILGKEIEIRPIKKPLDRYNRVLANIFVKNKDVGLKLVEEGLAYYYRPSCHDYPQDKEKYNYDPRPYIAAETKAKGKKLNIWSTTDRELPCDYRKGK